MRRFLLPLLLLPSLALAKGPVVSAQSAIIVDADTGKVLWSKDPDTKRFPASTTKIMTALLLIEHCPLDEKIQAPDDVQKVTEASLHLEPGEEVAAKQMLYALMLRSANDACYAVARHIGGSVEGFAKLMNERAKSIGCQNTTFQNPHGLNNDKHVTTARDLALIAREAVRYDVFNEVVKTYRHTIERSKNQEDVLLISKNKSLRKDPTSDGIKTGYTRPAGQCFVGSATRDGYRLITVILKSESWQDDNKAMLDWAFKQHESKAVAKAGEPIATAAVAGGASDRVEVVPEKDLAVIVPKGQLPKATFEFEAGGPIQAPVAAGLRVGFAVVKDGLGHEFRVPVTAATSVDSSRPLLGLAGGSGPSNLWLAAILGGAAILVRRRARRFRFQRG